jgi:hypothetical protein
MTIEDTNEKPDVEESANGASLQLKLLGMGAAIYAISFALPAVAGPGKSLPGWLCAWGTLALLADLRTPISFAFFASGLINPLAIAYLLFRAAGQAPKFRRALAIVALGFIPASWIAIANGFGIEIGHVAWVAGLLLMLVPEALGTAQTAR